MEEKKVQTPENQEKKERTNTVLDIHNTKIGTNIKDRERE